MLPGWLQDFLDLMCNENIVLTVEGERGCVDATIHRNSYSDSELLAEVIEASDFIDAMERLMEQYHEKRTEAESNNK